MVFKNEEQFKNQTGIYRIVNLQNNKTYIGQTIERFQRRFWHHRWCLENKQHHNKFLQNDYNNFGSDNFVFEVLYVANTNDDMDQLEKQYIKKYNSANKDSGYNLQSGGHFGFTTICTMSPEAKRRIGDINRKRMLGTKLSDETRAKMRASSHHRKPTEQERIALSKRMSNRVVLDETKEKLRQANIGSKSPVTKFTEDDVASIKQLLMENRTIKSIAEEYNVSMGAIGAIAAGRTWTHVQIDGWDDYLVQRKIKNKR